MAPKHGLSGVKQEEEQLAKRPKSEQTSRSSTPADVGAKVPYKVEYPDVGSKRALPKREIELAEAAEFMESPFVANGRSKDGEMDQYYTVTPIAEWAGMKKYNNFISELLLRLVKLLLISTSTRRCVQEQPICLRPRGNDAKGQEHGRRTKGFLGCQNITSPSQKCTTCVCISENASLFN